MDREQPALQYQYASAHMLHNHMPRVSHFMGTTLQERILQVALKGKPGPLSIWVQEEMRHGPIIQGVYNAVRPADRPPLKQQGIASKHPVTGAYAARSMMAARAAAEIAAGTAYLVLKANMKADSPAERVLDGIFRDEVYHYAVMSAVNKSAYRQDSRWHRLARIVRHAFDYRTPQPNDLVIHQSRIPSPLMVWELAYAFNAIDKRVDRFLRSLDEQTLRKFIGPVYRTDKEVQEAIARGEHTWTPPFRAEQNPELSLNNVSEMQRRFSGYFSVDHRSIRASDVRKILDAYRQTQLRNPSYWMRRKGFEEAEPGVLRRPLEKSAGAFLELAFGPDADLPEVIIGDGEGAGTARFANRIGAMSFLQIGAVMDAEDLGVVDKVEDPEVARGLTVGEIVKRLNSYPAYQKDPLRLIED